MAFSAKWINSGAMRRRLAEVAGATKPDSRPMDRLRRQVSEVLIEDNSDKILGRSVDRFGHRLAPLAPSTLKNKKRGKGPPLAPRGPGSRFITMFQVKWNRTGGGWKVAAGWVGFLSKNGFPIPAVHLTGGHRLPRRDVGGLSQRGWYQVRERFSDFVKSIARRGL